MLQVYHNNGFRFIHCNPDKSPKKKWRETRNHISLETATELQKTGEMIGAIIPEDIIVIDLDRHKGKPDGVESYKKVKDKYQIDINLINETFCVKTGSGGFHVFMYVGKDHGFVQGEKAPGIDLKTGAGYVIAAGSPGYTIHTTLVELDIEEIPESIKIWLESVNKKKPKNKKTEQTEYKNTNTIPIDLLDRILKKLDVKKFDSNEKWYNFIVSAIAATGANQEVYDLIVDWSGGDTNYKDVRSRVESFDSNGDITTGTFVHILREYGITQYFIKKVLSYNTSTELYETMRDDGHSLPFPDPDYEVISDSKEARELFITGGNSVAATLLGFAVQGHIIWSAIDKEFFFFDGNKWIEFYDMFSIAYTILIRLTKFMYAKKQGSDIDNENFIKLVKIINKTHWKRETINELTIREGIYHKTIQWDSIELKETLTCIDGVVDFSTEKIIIRNGLKNEFRKSHVKYKTEKIIDSSIPENYNKFLSDLFPDKNTLATVRQALSLYISGNPKKIFQIFHGGGDNGKTTLLELESEILGPDKAHKYSTEVLLDSKYKSEELPADAAKFEGKYLLYAEEVGKKKELSLGKIKNLTGVGSINARDLYKSSKTFTSTWQVVFSANDLPRFDGVDSAFVGRMLVIPFEMKFVWNEEEKKEQLKKGRDERLIGFKIEPDTLKKDIKKEFPGILKQKIEDYLKVKYDQGGKIIQSRKCKRHKQNYIDDNNDIGNFIEDMCIVSPDKEYFTTSENLTEAYREYSGLYKTSSKTVIGDIKKLRQEVSEGIEKVVKHEKDIKTGIYVDKEHRLRGLKNIKLKTIKEADEEAKEEKEEENLNKNYNDNIPF